MLVAYQEAGAQKVHQHHDTVKHRRHTIVGVLPPPVRSAMDLEQVMVVSNICLILSNRSRSRTIVSMLREPNAAVWWVVGGAAVMLAVVLNVPFLRGLFHFGPLHGSDIMLCVVAGAVSIMWFELLKVLRIRLA
jgi:hypothetical protein